MNMTEDLAIVASRQEESFSSISNPYTSTSSTTSTQRSFLKKREDYTAAGSGSNSNLTSTTAASSYALKPMHRTGSAGAPGLPESPLARSLHIPPPAVASPLATSSTSSTASGRLDPHRSMPSPLMAQRDHSFLQHQGGKVGGAAHPLLLQNHLAAPPLIRVQAEKEEHHPFQDAFESSTNLLEDNDDDDSGESDSNLLATYSLLGEKFDVEFPATPTPRRRGDAAARREGSLAAAAAARTTNTTTEDASGPSRQAFTKGKKQRIEIQTNTFTNWVNDRLKVGKHDRRVEDLFVDLQDGILLIKLLENLTKKKVPGFAGNTPKTEAHKLVNLDLAFHFMRVEEIKMIGVGGLNVYQGDTTLTLGMIWMLIQKYQMRMHGYKISTKKVMIQWLQALLPKWNISNLTSDWKDGRALIATIDAVKPGIAPSISKLDPTKHRNNCILATKIAHSYLKIPKIISPDDLSSGVVDELSMMTYLSYFVEPFQLKLLKWAQKMLPRHNISGFSTDWHDGRAYGGIVRACFPSVFVNWVELEMAAAASDDQEYVEAVFRTVERKLGVTPPFKAAELASGKVEELQVMTFLMQIRNGSLVPLADEVTVRGQGIEGANLHKETSFLIDTSDAGPGELYIDAVYEEDGQKLKFSLKEKTNRVFTLVYTPVLTSKIVFDVTWSETRVPRSPFVVPVTDSTLVKIVDFESHEMLVEVGKQLSLCLDTRRAGHGHLSAHLLQSAGGKERKIHATSSTKPETGYVQLCYTPTRAGTAVLHLFWNQEELHHLAITYTVVDVGGYSIHSFPPRDRVYCVFEQPEFCVASGKGLPLNVLQMTAILTLDVQLPITFRTVEGNKGYASFTPTLPGEYRVEVVCVDQLVKGTPFTVCVSDPSSCKVKGEIPPFLRKGRPHVFEIDTRGAVAAAGAARGITFASTDHDDISSLFKVSRAKGGGRGGGGTKASGDPLQRLEVTPIAEGDFVVGVKCQNQWISNCPFRLHVCDPEKFQVAESLGSSCIGKPVEFTIRARERGSSAAEGGLDLVIKANGPSAKYSPQVQVSEDGLRHAVTFVPWEMGEHEVSVTYGSFDIVGSPLLFAVVSFDADECSVTGSGLQRAFASVPSHFLVLSRQEGLLEDGTLDIGVASVVDQSRRCRVRARDNKNGTYSVAYLIQTPGAYLISVVLAGHHIPGSPFKLNALQGPEAHKCRMYGPALEEETILTFGKPIDFTVDASKAGNGKLAVKAVGPEASAARVFVAKSEQAGKYDISVDVLRHGKHKVSVKWSNRHVPGSPFLIKVFPGADSRKCLAYGPGLEDGWVGKKSSFTIETKNAGAGMLRVRLHGLKGAFKIQVAPVDQKQRRTLLANYNPTLPGEYLITIKWSETHVPGSPFRVRITGDRKSKNNRMLLAPPATGPSLATPTPRMTEDDDMSGFLDDDDDYTDDSSSNGLRALHSAPSVTIQSPNTKNRKQQQQQHPVMFRHGAKEAARARRRSDGKVVDSNKPTVPPVVRRLKRNGGGGGGGGARGVVKSSEMARKKINGSSRVGEFEGQVKVHVNNPKTVKVK